MSTAVIDSSVIHYLVLIDGAHLLPILFEKVYLAEEVYRELTHRRTPKKVRDFISQDYPWLEIHTSPLQTSERPIFGFQRNILQD